MLKSERNLSQYTIGRGSTSLKKRLSSRGRSLSAPPGRLIPVHENGPTLNDWRQRFVEVRSRALAQPTQGWHACALALPQERLSSMHVHTLSRWQTMCRSSYGICHFRLCFCTVKVAPAGLAFAVLLGSRICAHRLCTGLEQE